MAHSLPVLVVPCFNEARRLDTEAFTGLARSGRLTVLFVDDGSLDSTPSVIDRMSEQCDGISALFLPHNKGKAEAVRAGLLHGLKGGAPVVGYCDADLATPPDELLRLLDTLEDHPATEVVMGSRIARLGSTIQRSGARHVLGRIFASAASWALGVTTYDTQCGAKFFRSTPMLEAALATPFPSAWSFDVRLMDRLLRGGGPIPGLPADSFVEVPLRSWIDVGGSKVDVSGSVKAFIDVIRMRFEHGSQR